MGEENQLYPLAPAKLYGRSDEEEAAQKPYASSRREEKNSKCFVHILTGIVIQTGIILFFAIIFLKVKLPDAKMSSITIENLKYGNSSSASLSATMNAIIKVKNANFGRFEPDNTIASVLYRDSKLGEANISETRVKAQQTKRVDCSFDLTSNGLSGDKNFSSEIDSGILKIRSYASFSGKVHLMKIIKKRKTTVMNCTMNLILNISAIEDLICF